MKDRRLQKERPDFIYFHSERGRKSDDSAALELHSASLIDFFVEVGRHVSRMLIVLPRGEKPMPVTLSYEGNTKIVELPYPQSHKPGELFKLLLSVRGLLSDPLFSWVRASKCTASPGLDFVGTIVGLIRIYVARAPHCFIVRGDRVKTLRLSSRGRLSKWFALFRVYLYRYVIDRSVRRGYAQVWFQGGSNCRAFRSRLGKPYADRLLVLNAVLDERAIGGSELEDRTAALYDLVFVGRLHREKGIFDLVEAIRRLKEKGRDLLALVIGAGRDEEELKKKVSKCGLEKHFIFTGYISNRKELARRVSSARLFVLPSHTEGMPRAMVEAMYLGVPVLVTRVGGIPYVVKDGVNGLLVDAKDPDALGRRISEGLNGARTGANADMISAARELALSMSFHRRAHFFLKHSCGNMNS